MTGKSKSIIINGVDVSKCERLIINKTYGYVCNCEEDTHLISSCKNRPYCYFKQLEHKEQELQQAMDNYVQLDLQRVKEYNELVDLYKAKEQECEELKNKLKHIRDENIHLKESATDEQIDFLALNNYIKTLEFQIDQLKAENKEIHNKGQEEINKLCIEKSRLYNELDKLKAENDKYSLFIEKLCDYAGLECDNEEQAIRTLTDFASQMYKAKVINDQLKVSKEQAEQKLEQIRDIAEKDINFCLKCNEGKEIDCIDCIEGGRALSAKEILQIIDEVE